jgi:hypothetical protein
MVLAMILRPTEAKLLGDDADLVVFDVPSLEDVIGAPRPRSKRDTRTRPKRLDRIKEGLTEGPTAGGWLRIRVRGDVDERMGLEMNQVIDVEKRVAHQLDKVLRQLGYVILDAALHQSSVATILST